MSNYIESVGVNAVKEALLETTVVDVGGISENDRTISWDGEILLFSSNQFEKSNLKGKIPVQIKTRTLKEPTNKLCVSKYDLENYYKEGGVLFFFVNYINDSIKKIYYAPLHKFDLKGLLEKTEDTNERTVYFKPLPDNPKEVISILNGFICEKRRQNLMPKYKNFDEFIQKNPTAKLTFNIETNKPINTIEELEAAVTEQEPFIHYLNDETGAEFVVEKFDKKQFKFFVRKNVDISIGDKVYFKNVSQINSSIGSRIETVNLYIIHTKKDGSITFRFKERGTVNERFALYSFLFGVSQSGYFNIDKSKIGLEGKQLDVLKEKVVGKYTIYMKLKSVLDFFGVSKEPDFTKSIKLDYTYLDILYKCCVLKEEYIANNVASGIYVVSLFGLSFLIYAKEVDGKVFLSNWDDIELWLGKRKTHPFILLSTQDINVFVKIDNIDLKSLVRDIKKINPTKDEMHYINLIGINLITAFDLTENKTFLKTSKQIIDFLLKIEPGNINFIINYYQIIRRMKRYSLKDSKYVMTLIEKYKDEAGVLFALYVVLKDKKKSDFYLSQMNEDQINQFKKWPIFTLYKVL